MVSRIASANRPAGATQDQTLLAILHANPDAFMADNINLLKKGAALTMPTAEQALSVPAEEARALIRSSMPITKSTAMDWCSWRQPEPRLRRLPPHRPWRHRCWCRRR